MYCQIKILHSPKFVRNMIFAHSNPNSFIMLSNDVSQFPTYWFAFLFWFSFVAIVCWFYYEVRGLISSLPRFEKGDIKTSNYMQESNMASGTEYNKVIKNLEDAGKLINATTSKIENFCERWIWILAVWGILFLVIIYLSRPDDSYGVIKRLDNIEKIIREKCPG